VPDSRGSVEAIAEAILAHLDTHPLAADSASGVAQWWLGPAQANASLESVEKALEWLVSRQQLHRTLLSDGSLLYSRSLPTRH
jgi:hypothetical protein